MHPLPRARGAALGAWLALLAAAPAAAAPEGGSLSRAAEELASRIAEGTAPDRVALAVAAPGADGLADPFAAALTGALARRRLAPIALRGREAPEQAARAQGADRLVRVRLALSAGGRELAVAAEVASLRENFFLQRTRPPAEERLVAFAVAADAVARALSRPAAVRRLPSPVLVPLFAFPEPVLALAVLEGGDGASLVAATPEGLVLLSTAGQRLAFRAAPPAAGPPLRQPAAALAVGEFGGGRIAWQLAGRPEAEVLATEGGRLEPVARVPAAPLAAGGAGSLFGAFAPGLPAFQDRVATSADAAAPLRSARRLLGAAAAPRPGRAAFAVLHDDDRVEILDASLAPSCPAVEGVGGGLALADLGGEGEAELVASSAEPGESDRVRVLRLFPSAETVYQSQPVPGAILAAAAGDLTGDGLDDAVLAAVQPSGETRLWLLTADPREAGR
jgi:hypothetical protein